MLSATIAIHWHDDGHPVYSLDFQNSESGIKRLATAGGDKNVRIWEIKQSQSGDPQHTLVEYLSTLRKHSQAVNTVRFDPSGRMLASAGDDGLLIIWTMASRLVHEFGVQDDDMKESWVVHQVHNTNLEIYDICWSPDSKFIAAGSMDNITRIFSLASGQKVTEMTGHSHYVQGVVWDPLNEFIATQSADRSVCVHSLHLTPTGTPDALSARFWSKLARAEMPMMKVSDLCSTNKLAACTKDANSLSVRNASIATKPDSSLEILPVEAKLVKKGSQLYHSENLQSFFRRLAFSPDGSILVAPLGVCRYENDNEETVDAIDRSIAMNTVYVYSRAGLNQSPICHLPGLPKPAIAISFNPIKYETSGTGLPSAFALPYKLVFAVATHDAVILYDTESLQPLGILSNLHYLSITDLCWDHDGDSLMVSSAEGFCSLITFEVGTFGKVFGRNEIPDNI